MTEQIPGFDRFDHADAFAVGVGLAERCAREQLPVTISIRLGEQRVFHAALRGSSADNDAWVDRKCRTVQRFGQSSQAVYERYAKADPEKFYYHFGLSPTEYAAGGGAVPIWVGGALAGVVGMSGLSSEEDHALVVSALAELSAERRNPSPGTP